MKFNAILTAAAITVFSTTTPPVFAGDLTSNLGALSGLASGDSSVLMDAALSKIGLSDEVISQAKPILTNAISKGKEIMGTYGYNGESTEGMSSDAVTKMKSALMSQVTSSESSLSSIIPTDSMGTVMSLLKSQFGKGLL